MTTTIFGYRHVDGIPNCPCNDPGNYVMLEQLSDGTYRFRCWCGSTSVVTFDDNAERDEFIAKWAGDSRPRRQNPGE